MTRYLWIEGAWQEARPAPPPAGPYIITDSMPAACHPVSGQVMDSKSAFRRATREAGCVELGNDAAPPPREYVADKSLRADIADALTRVEQGQRPPKPEAAVGETRLYAVRDGLSTVERQPSG